MLVKTILSYVLGAVLVFAVQGRYINIYPSQDRQLLLNKAYLGPDAVQKMRTNYNDQVSTNFPQNTMSHRRRMSLWNFFSSFGILPHQATTFQNPRLSKRGHRIRTGRRRDYLCDVTGLTIQTIIEYINSNTICGFQVTGMRFGMGG